MLLAKFIMAFGSPESTASTLAHIVFKVIGNPRQNNHKGSEFPSIVSNTNYNWLCTVLSALSIHILWWFCGPWPQAVLHEQAGHSVSHPIASPSRSQWSIHTQVLMFVFNHKQCQSFTFYSRTTIKNFHPSLSERYCAMCVMIMDVFFPQFYRHGCK